MQDTRKHLFPGAGRTGQQGSHASLRHAFGQLQQFLAGRIDKNKILLLLGRRQQTEHRAPRLHGPIIGRQHVRCALMHGLHTHLKVMSINPANQWNIASHPAHQGLYFG